MRDFVARHPDYKHDSVVPASVANDLVKHCIDVSNGRTQDASLLGDFLIPDIDSPLRVPKQGLKGASPLRGSSFRREVGISNKHAFQCAIVRALVEKHKHRQGAEHAVKDSRNFIKTPAFLNSDKLAQK